MFLRQALLLSLFMLVCMSGSAQDLTIGLQQVGKDLTAPVAMAVPSDGTNRIFVCEQNGKVKILTSDPKTHKVFLDISDKMVNIGKAYSEKGLLGIAFHPQYKTNGRFFLCYSAPSTGGGDHLDVVAEYHVSSNKDVADPSSGRIILSIVHPNSNHNGGQLAFGPDGFLYIAIGDGGGSGGESGSKGTSQDLNSLLGKILRIDVNGKQPYAIPADNPFAGRPGSKGEIYAYGLRNPWRFSFDKKSGRLFCGDVGQHKYEEIDIIVKGGNYGWRIMEGDHCYDPPTNCDQKGLIKPIAEYGRQEGISVIGGFVYNGKAIASLKGKYIFGDWKGALFALEETGGSWTRKNLKVTGEKGNFDQNINSFGEDENGELYMLTQKFTGTFTATGSVYRMVK